MENLFDGHNFDHEKRTCVVLRFSPRLCAFQNWLSGPVGRFLYLTGENFDFNLLLCHPNTHSGVNKVKKNKWFLLRCRASGWWPSCVGWLIIHYLHVAGTLWKEHNWPSGRIGTLLFIKHLPPIILTCS